MIHAPAVRGMWVFALAASLLVSVPLKSWAGDGRCADDYLGCGVDSDGAYAGLMPRAEVVGLPRFPGDKGGPEDPKAAYFEYVSLPDCEQNDPARRGEVMCSKAVKQCPPELAGNTRLRIWRRLVTPPDVRGPWTAVGVTCHSDVAPGSRPRLTMAEIRAAFLRTPWARPSISTQPAGGVTLVNLKTFYRVQWSAQGFAPGEVDPKVLRGIPVSIRPKLIGFVYDFGDGERLGPTDSLGGTYPDGDVVHTYRRPGSYTSHVMTTFGADFSLDGGRTWDAIPATVDVPGPVTAVTVKEARAVLVR